jgi:hypothetical protein
MFVVSTRQGRVLRISAPSVGSSLTHQTSPRRGTGPRFAGFVGDCVELFFNSSDLRIVVRYLATLQQKQVARGKLLAECVGQILGTFSGRNSAHKLQGQVFWQREGHLAGRHSAILPYKRRTMPEFIPKRGPSKKQLQERQKFNVDPGDLISGPRFDPHVTCRSQSRTPK